MSKNASLWIFVVAFGLGVSLAFGVPLFGQLKDDKVIAPLEFQKIKDPQSKNLTQYSLEELSLLELRKLNAK